MTSFKTPGKGTELPIMQLKGKDYLMVAYRLVWFREEKPNWSIETQILESTPDFTLAKATVKDETGKIIATAHKTETKQGFADHLEKAETGSIGRALSLCGYGTQFAPDLDEGERLADAPVSRPPQVKAAQKPETKLHAAPSQPTCCGSPMSRSLYPEEKPENERPFRCRKCRKQAAA